MLPREKQVLRAAHRIYRSGKTFEIRLSAAVQEMLFLGGIYVKFAQLLLLNETFATALPAELRRAVFDRVHVDESLDHTAFFTARDFDKLAPQVAKISSSPSYAGSFAAVFDARLHNGQSIIIKVIRPELRQHLRRDLRLLGLLAKSIGIFKEEVKLGIQQTLADFRESTLRETDYKTEIEQTKQLGEIFRSDPFVRIPHIYTHLSNEHMIVQEKFDGVWLTELLDRNSKGHSAEVFVWERVRSNLTQQLYHLGYQSLYNTLSGLVVHGDPHPGNVVLMSNDQIGLIDVGIIGKPVHNRLALLEYIKEQLRRRDGDIDTARLMLAIVRFHAGYLYRAVESLSKVYKRPLLKELYSFLQTEAKKFQTDVGSLGKGQYSDMLSASINENNRFALIPKIDTPITQKAFITIWRTYDELGFSDLTFKVFRDVVTAIERDNSVATWLEQPMSPDKAFEIVAKWLSKVAEKDPQLFLQLQQLFQPKNKFS